MNRRFFLGGLLAAPAIVRASSLDGLAFLRPTPAPSAASIISLDVTGTNLFVMLSDGSTIGPLLLPTHQLTVAQLMGLGFQKPRPDWMTL